ncbi:4023_t:CDS:2 [Diversispora eburnea]|uniref:Acyl-protein thioesterase 1 n=1 Tax=Diversispora eburnea TaxID=1213867 RepID=A0A9N9BCR2_9GLOM|nr:4023_t:CDS:2 [Diversispora eburnea]
MALTSVIIPSRRIPHTASGLGDSGEGWAPVMSEIRKKLDHVKFVLPNAPIRPVTVNVNRIIRDEIDSGIPSNRIVIGGFSQGAATSLVIGLTSEYPLAGMMVLSGYLPLKDKIFNMTTESNKGIPVLICHGDIDEVVPYEGGKQTHELLKTKGYSVNFKTYPGMGHSSTPEEFNDMIQFLNQVIPDL